MNFPILQNISAKSPKIPKLQHSPSTAQVSLQRDDCEEFEIRVRIIDQAVGVTLGAIVAETGMDRSLLPVKDYRAVPCRDENDFAAVFVGMHPDRRARHKKPFHDAVGPVKEHFRTQFLLPSLERGKKAPSC